MRLPRISSRLVLPGVLMALVVLLATLQYQWLGKVSEAERAQMLRSLSQRAREFAADFDTELAQLTHAYAVSRDVVDGERLDGMVEAITRWQASAKFPHMVKAIYLADSVDGAYALWPFALQERRFEAAPLPTWPAALEPVRVQLASSDRASVTQTTFRTTSAPQVPVSSADLAVSGVVISRQSMLTAASSGGAAALGRPAFFSLRLMPSLPDIPALLMPLSRPVTAVVPGFPLAPVARATDRAQSATTTRTFDPVIVVWLDAAYLTGTVLPTLAARHFPELNTDGYRMAVVSTTNALLYSRDVPGGQLLDPSHADVAQPFFSSRPDILPSQTLVTAQSRANTQGPDSISVLVQQPAASSTQTVHSVATAAQIRFGAQSWRLLLQHRSGSLDIAVSQARQRNLWLSFGILGVLAAGLVIVLGNARRAEQLAARRMDLVATVSHELRTPLAVIRSAAQNLSAGVVADPAHARRYGELIEGEGLRLTETVEQVMALAGLESGKPLQAARPVDVPALVDDVMQGIAAQCETAGITVDVSFEDEEHLPTIMADETVLRRALQNLLGNAIKHGGDGTWIGVSVSRATTRGKHELRIAVSDHGRGIDPADVRHVFEPFHRGRHAIDQQVHGNGLGLHLVKLIAAAHGGRVTVRSTPGEGATFVMHLPVAPSGSSRAS
jgi:signal transduction histidine kinase